MNIYTLGCLAYNVKFMIQLHVDYLYEVRVIELGMFGVLKRARAIKKRDS